MKKKPFGKGYGADEAEVWSIIGSVGADIQPYNGGLAQKEYGLSVECQKRMYTDLCQDIMEGVGISLSEDAKAPEYEVIYAEHWEDYTMAILKKRVV